MSFATIRLEKVVGSESFDSRSSHNNRKIITANINKKFIHKNIHIQDIKYKNFDDFVETKRTQIKNHNEKFKTKNRMIRKVLNKKTGKKDYKGMSQEFVISSSPDFLSEKENIEYLKKADEFLRNHFPECEVLQSVIHLDEKTPHLHFHISYFDKYQNKFIQDKLIKEERTDINKIRDLFQEEVAKPFGLKKQDGTVVKNHNAKASLEIMELKKEVKELEDELKLFKEKLKGSLGFNNTLKTHITSLESKLKTFNEHDIALGKIAHLVGFKSGNVDDLVELVNDKLQNTNTEKESTRRINRNR